MKLESYEDTLNNIAFVRSNLQSEALELMTAESKEEYLLSYMMDIESEGSASLLMGDAFVNPFNYQLKIANGTETEIRTVDLVETFNYLLGLKVKHIDVIQNFKVVIGDLRTGERVLVIWRKISEKSNEELEEFFIMQGYNARDSQFDRIYVNGDSHLELLRSKENKWNVMLIEEEFKRLMFDVQDK